jgi:phage recombination protein Bet
MNDIAKIDYNNKQMIQTLKSTVAVDATDSEFFMFCELAKATGLNPFKREIWFIKTNSYTNKYGKFIEGKAQIMTGINGFHSIANSHPQYDGIETGFVGKDGEYLPITYPKPDFIGAWAKVYRKDRRIPIEAVAMLDEYQKTTGNWPSMRRVMIVKCAESLALRKSFPQELNGLYTVEEMPVEFSASAQVVQKEPQKAVFKISEEGNNIAKTMSAIDGGSAYGYDIPKMTGKKR